jgi:hypothetical protein
MGPVYPITTSLAAWAEASAAGQKDIRATPRNNTKPAKLFQFLISLSSSFI